MAQIVKKKRTNGPGIPKVIYLYHMEHCEVFAVDM